MLQPSLVAHSTLQLALVAHSTLQLAQVVANIVLYPVQRNRRTKHGVGDGEGASESQGLGSQTAAQLARVCFHLKTQYCYYTQRL